MNKRFTLIELLTCVAIIGILISMLLPALGRTKERSKRVICSNNLKNIQITQVMYAGENRQHIILGDCFNIHQTSMYLTRKSGQHGVFEPLYTAGYMNEAQAWYCPSNRYVSTSGASPYTYDATTWPPAIGGINSSIGYSSRVKVKTIKGTEFSVSRWEDGWPTNSAKLSKMDPNQVIMSDIVSYTILVRQCHAEGVNAVRVDGSTHWVPLDRFYNHLLAMSSGTSGWGWASAYNNDFDNIYRKLDE